MQGRQRSLQCYRSQGYGHRQSECPTKVITNKDQKRSIPVSQSNKNDSESHEDGEEAFTCVNMKRPRSSGNSKKCCSDRLPSNDDLVYSAACRAQNNKGQTYIEVRKLNGWSVKVL